MFFNYLFYCIYCFLPSLPKLYISGCKISNNFLMHKLFSHNILRMMKFSSIFYQNLFPIVSLLRSPSQKRTVSIPRTYVLRCKTVRFWDGNRKRMPAKTIISKNQSTNYPLFPIHSSLLTDYIRLRCSCPAPVPLYLFFVALNL